MIKEAKLHHVGYVVADIRQTARLFAYYGYQADNILFDEKLNVELCYLRKSDTVAIELVHQLQTESLESKLFRTSGVMPYHLCYEVTNFDEACKEMGTTGFQSLFDPVSVEVLENKRICYFHHPDMGYIELMEK